MNKVKAQIYKVKGQVKYQVNEQLKEQVKDQMYKVKAQMYQVKGQVKYQVKGQVKGQVKYQRPTQKGQGTSAGGVSSEGGVPTFQQRKGKQVVDESEGLQDVAVVLTFKGHAAAQDLIQSHYSEAEVLRCLIENPIEVEQITPSPKQEDVDEACIEETQDQVQNEELPASRIRKKSQRIVLKKLGKKFGGPRATSDAPYSLD
ncbi:hypothetical protein LXL04_039130 [Taraxacum kok-saghyz]